MSDVFSSGAGVVSGILSGGAAKKASDQQSAALQMAMDSIDKNLDPSVVNDKALKADLANAKARLDAQKQIDPQLYAQRSLAQQILTGQLKQIGASPSDVVAQQAAMEGLTQAPGMQEAKNRLVDAALQEVKLGATLPPDIQAELMQSGLQQTGAVTGAATARGAGGTILQQVLGLGGLQLQQQRQLQAANLLKSASDLDAQRQQILQNLFPRLQQQQLANISGASGIFQQANAAMPQAGLTGNQVANIWLQKVGAQSGLMQQLGKVNAAGTLGAEAGTEQALGAGASGVGSIAAGLGVGGISSFFNSIIPSGGVKSGKGVDYAGEL